MFNERIVMKINLTNEEVCEIIEKYVLNKMLISGAFDKKKISATGASYTGLAATVTVEDAPVDSEKEA